MQLCVDQLNNLALRVEGRNSLGNGDCVEGDDGKVTLKASSRGGFLANFYFDQGNRFDAALKPTKILKSAKLHWLTESFSSKCGVEISKMGNEEALH